MITVNKPFMPPLEEYADLLEGIWKRNWLTNHGPLVAELESKLKDFLQVDNLLFLTNGTIALQIAIKALGIKGEVITTPFSYVATTSSIIWENCTPVFVDICPETLNIDPAQIEQAITRNTTAILATHVFGNPCDVEEIDQIASRHGLKVIYDGAHAFGVRYKGKSIFQYGHISTASFHATKIFHTVEGGAVITSDEHLNHIMSGMRNFGHNGPYDFYVVGINGKNSELHAAMGLLNLKYIHQVISKKKELYLLYRQKLTSNRMTYQVLKQDMDYNYSYFPVIFDKEENLLKVINTLERNNIHPRRYFYPSLNTLKYLHGKNKVRNAESISARILCLPHHYYLTTSQVDMIATLINNTIN